jgi:hypothetical protein
MKGVRILYINEGYVLKEQQVNFRLFVVFGIVALTGIIGRAIC